MEVKSMEDCSLWEGLGVGSSWRNVSRGSDGAALVGTQHPSSANPAHSQGQLRCWEDEKQMNLCAQLCYVSGFIHKDFQNQRRAVEMDGRRGQRD